MGSKKLLRQIKKAWGSENFNQEMSELGAKLKSGEALRDSVEWGKRFVDFNKFIEMVDKSYSRSGELLAAARKKNKLNFKNVTDLEEAKADINKSFSKIVTNLDEGFFVINKQGFCGKVVSVAAKNFIGWDPVDTHITKILNIKDEDKEIFNEWLEMVFVEKILFEDLIVLAPKRLDTADKEKHIEIKFKPIRDSKNQKICELAVILTDITEQVEIELKLGEQKIFIEMMVKYLNNRQNFARMLQMMREIGHSMIGWSCEMSDFEEQNDLLTRELHTLKSGLNTLSMLSLGAIVHEAESHVIQARQRKANFKEMEDVIHELGHGFMSSLEEFLFEHRRIFKIENRYAVKKETATQNIYKFCAELLNMGLNDLLKYYVDEIVVVPFPTLFAPIEANVYTQSLNQDKSVDFEVFDPQEICVIPEYYTNLFENISHLFNNIFDHGIEKTEERQAFQKPLTGKIQVHLEIIENTAQERQDLRILVSDDGRGIDPSVVRKKLSESGINTDNESDQQVIHHIFDHGFTTRKIITSSSGRGVGMTALAKCIESMGGAIKVSSTMGIGTTFEITVPFVREFNATMIQWLNAGGFESKKTILDEVTAA